MIDRINLILKAKNVTARQFAEEIGIQPSGMSHILSGRNRPSLDFVLKVINRYPEIDINWLMFGKGEMIAPQTVPVAASAPVAVSSPVAVPTAAAAPQPPVGNESGRVVSRPSGQQSLYPELDLFSGTEAFDSVEPSGQPVPDTPQTVVQQVSSPSAPQTLPFNGVQDSPETETDVHKPERRQLDENAIFHKAKSYGTDYSNVVKKKIAKVVILYTDHSFSEYYPEN